MKILFVSASPINAEVSVGNTFLNIMPDNIEKASIYTKKGLPDKRIDKAFCINEKMIINRILGREKCAGKIITGRYGEDKRLNNKAYTSDEVVNFARKKRYTVFFWLQNILWLVDVWKTSLLKKFVKDFDADIVFTVLNNNIYLNRLILYILKISGKPLVLYAWDNNYCWNKYQCSPLKWINQFFERIYMRKIVDKAQKFYVISDIQKEDYEQIFHQKCTVLTKGADFTESAPVKRRYNEPLQMVYTGNIGNNRWKSLGMLVNVVEQLNHNKIQIQLSIYTATPLTGEMQKALSVKGCSTVMGSVSADKIPEIQSNADILVHVEAFDAKNKFAVRQSFSTKIVDYLASARCILAIGPKDIASIHYFVKNEAGFVASSEGEIMKCLEKIIQNPKLLAEYGEKAYDSGKRNHNKEKITEILTGDFINITRKGK